MDDKGISVGKISWYVVCVHKRYGTDKKASRLIAGAEAGGSNRVMYTCMSRDTTEATSNHC